MQYGLIEIKCPYKYRNLTPEDACLNGDFCSTLSTSKQIQLKWNEIVSPVHLVGMQMRDLRLM